MQAAAHVEHLRGGQIRRNTERERMRRGNLTIPVLVEEAEGLLELGDLVVGELVRHGLHGLVSSRGERASERTNGGRGGRRRD